MRHTFRSGSLTAADAQVLTEMAKRLDGQVNLSVRPPLYMARQGFDGQPLLYLQQAAGSGGSSGFVDLILGSTAGLSAAAGVAQDILSVTIPADGDYAFWYSCSGSINASNAGAYIQAWLRYPGTPFGQAISFVASAQVAGQVGHGTGSGFQIYTCTTGQVIKLQAARVFTGTVSQSDVFGASSAWNTMMRYVKFA